MASTAALAPSEIRVHEAGDVRLTLQSTPQAGYLIQGRRNGVIARDLCSQHRTETAALYAWAELVTAHQAAGQSTTVQLGATAIQVTQMETGVWRVQTTTGGRVVEAWTMSYAERGTAAREWRRVAAALRTHGSVEAIERRAHALRFEVRDLLNARRLNRTRLAAVERELDLLADLQTYVPALAAA
jgi:hypothetical protein